MTIETSDFAETGFSTAYPTPPRIHWALLLSAYVAAAALIFLLKRGPLRDVLSNVFIAAWPIYISVWVRKIDTQSQTLYWALASFATGFLFSWLLWIVVIFQLREELLAHYNKREPIDLRLNFWMSTFFSFVYFQYKLSAIADEKEEFLDEYYT
jgi:DNA integrity scanning protein DisA with diadenylate cyclase activity